MTTSRPTTHGDVEAILLRRSGLVFVPAGDAAQTEVVMQALDLELAELGYVVSTRLRAALARLDDAELAAILSAMCSTLARQLGAHVQHRPLFRRFPDEIPDSTAELWSKKVLVHFVQAEDQACLFCRSVGTTHVLQPCLHVVCDRCFDGSSYGACPICERHVDPGSPFFTPTPESPQAARSERVRLRLLDLDDGLDGRARDIARTLLSRAQALSPVDRGDLTHLCAAYGERMLAWLPEEIPVRENIAIAFGTLLETCTPASVLPIARRYVRTATDVLRLVAVYSGADASLQGEMRRVVVPRVIESPRWWGKIAALLGARPPTASVVPEQVQIHSHRFRVRKLSRALRRALLALLEANPAESLTEDMLRHRSYWVWLGEHLHPHEYASRFPKTAEAFAVVRRKAPDGTCAPKFVGFYGRMERAAARRDGVALAGMLRARPGELARRFDHALRLCAGQAEANEVIATFASVVDRVSTPVLVTLAAALPRRVAPLPVRVYFPKGGTVAGVRADDRRPTLTAESIARALGPIEGELLRRFAAKPRFQIGIVDDDLASIVAPFNERTASLSGVALPRGSVVAVEPGRMTRLFMHWCQPETSGYDTDLDLSVGFYDASWTYVGVCSYDQLKLSNPVGDVIARSSGDLRDAPFPDGASEFVDIDHAVARAAGIRYAVMVVNAYSGMPFGLLERAFAGLMLRDDAYGLQFDPRTVELAFGLQGDHGVFMPLVFDLEANSIHWVDAYAKGKFAFNNVESSNRAITRICPDSIAYFGSGTRMSMRDLLLLHAAARCDRVVLRGDRTVVIERAAGEGAASFVARIRRRDGHKTSDVLPIPPGTPVFAGVLRGDLELAPGSECYALYRERVTQPIAAGDLLA